MALSVETLEAELLHLPTAERARLLERLIASLDADAQREAAWARLAAEREAQWQRGEVQPVDSGALLAQLRAELS